MEDMVLLNASSWFMFLGTLHIVLDKQMLGFRAPHNISLI